MNFLKPVFCFRIMMALLLAVTALTIPAAAQSTKPAAMLTVQGQGMAPNQTVTLSTGPKQKLEAKATQDGKVIFRNLKYTPTNNLTFSLAYSVKGNGAKIIPNTILMNLDPFTGTVGMRGNASRAASVIVNVSSEDSKAIIANQKGYFAGNADSISGFSKGALKVVTSIINVEESCCPRAIKPYAPVLISITSEPVKKAALAIVSETETASLEIDLPDYAYASSVSVPDALFEDSWLKGIGNFSNSVVNAMHAQLTALGSFMNAQNHADAVRSLQERSARAAKNFLPSEQLCRYASLSQSLVASETGNKAGKLSLMAALQANEMSSPGSTKSATNSNKGIMDGFQANNCDPADNNSSMECKKSKNDKRFNMDVDYTRAIDAPLTLDVDFSDGKGGGQEQDIITMAENLFPSRSQNKGPDEDGYRANETEYRSLQAMRSIAKNTFVSQVTEKSRGTSGSAEYISKLVQSLGFSESVSKKIIGENPSYYAQMEVLTKKIFQDPGFYINMIDTPANVERQKAAIRAIKLQQQNDFAQVVKRREMLLSMLLEMKLRERSDRIEQRQKPDSDKKIP